MRKAEQLQSTDYSVQAISHLARKAFTSLYTTCERLLSTRAILVHILTQLVRAYYTPSVQASF